MTINENNHGYEAPNLTKSYLFFLSGQIISILGSNIVQFALIWWITITSESDPFLTNYTGLVLGVAAFLGYAPTIFTFLISGVLVDRWNRKKLIFAMDFTQALFSTLLVFLFLANQATIYVVLVILTIRGIANGFHMPAERAIIPLMVPRDKLTRVDSIQSFGNNFSNLIGPIAGAVLIGLFSLEQIWIIIAFDGITFLIALIPLIIIKIPPVKRKAEFVEKPSFKAEFTEGVSFIKQTKGLLALLTTFTMANLVLSPVNILLPLVVIGTFSKNVKGGSAILAIAFVMTPIGSILVSLFLTKYKIFKENVKGVVLGQGIMYIVYFAIIISILYKSTNILYGAMFIFGCAIILANVHSQTIWQSVVPPELQGRVMSVRMVIAWSTAPFSMLFAGALADIIGYTTLFIGCAIFGSLYLIFAWFFTGLPRVEADLGLNNPQTNDFINGTEEKGIKSPSD